VLSERRLVPDADGGEGSRSDGDLPLPSSQAHLKTTGADDRYAESCGDNVVRGTRASTPNARCLHASHQRSDTAKRREDQHHHHSDPLITQQTSTRSPTYTTTRSPTPGARSGLCRDGGRVARRELADVEFLDLLGQARCSSRRGFLVIGGVAGSGRSRPVRDTGSRARAFVAAKSAGSSVWAVAFRLAGWWASLWRVGCLVGVWSLLVGGVWMSAGGHGSEPVRRRFFCVFSPLREWARA
jgi:hypothetical protein